MIIALYIVLTIALCAIFYQDQKERMVSWWLFPLVGAALSGIHILKVGTYNFLTDIIFNISIVFILLGVLFLYTKIRGFRFKNVFGFGDICFLFALALGFTTMGFITLLVFGLLFSLLLHHVLNIKKIRPHTQQKETTVPLAGYLAIFFGGTILAHWCGLYNNLYLL